MPAAPVSIRLLASICARNDFYLDRIRSAADSVGLAYILEKVTDDAVIDEKGLTMPCLYAYCPGCRALNEQVTAEHPEARCTPALEINGELVFWGVPASDEALRERFSQYLQEGC